MSIRDCLCRSVSIVRMNSRVMDRRRKGAIPSIVPRTLTTATIHLARIPSRTNTSRNRTSSPGISTSAECSEIFRSIQPWIVRIANSTSDVGNKHDLTYCASIAYTIFDTVYYFKDSKNMEDASLFLRKFGRRLILCYD
uniref:Uncharacterized protein n=1 Tax=Anopheles farauti TaxID=69004 RepID=A0A182QB09_9DIPT